MDPLVEKVSCDKKKKDKSNGEYQCKYLNL